MKYKILHYACLIIMMVILTISLGMFSNPKIKPGNGWYDALCLIIAVLSVSIMLLGDHINDKLKQLLSVKQAQVQVKSREPKFVGTGMYVHEQFRFREHELVPGDIYFDADFGEMVWTGKEWLSTDKVSNN